jgi:hypothetical protein
LHIIGQSQLFPYPDGDLPDETKFVRIFVGLKGTGTLCADDIKYVYNNQNFTMEERLSKFIDSSFSKAQLLIPQPRSIKVLESKVYYWPDHENNFPLILIPSTVDELTWYSAKILEQKILDNLKEIGKVDKSDNPSLIRKLSGNEQNNATIIFSVGKTDLFNKYKDKLPLVKIKGQEQGYFIYSMNSLTNIVFIYGNSPQGNLYAIQSVVQLFDNQRLLFHNANIIDYPSENQRSLLVTNFEQRTFKSMCSSGSFRFNEIYFPSNSNFLSLAEDIDQKAIRENIYFDLEDEITTTESENIKTRLIDFSKNNSDHTYLFSSFSLKNMNVEAAMNQYYIRSDNQSSFLSSISALLNSDSMKALNFEIMPPEADNLDINFTDCNQISLNEILKKNRNTNYVWTGYGLQSWKIDEADLLRIRQYYSSFPVFMDFSLYPKSVYMNYFANDSVNPYKLMTACLFDAYNNCVVKEVYKKSKKNIVVYSCSNLFDEIRLKTASDFYWNREDYDSEYSLYKALVSEFGFDATRKIVKFNDLYFRAKTELILAANKKNMHRHARRAIQLLTELKKTDSDLKTGNYNASVRKVSSIFTNLLLKLELTKDKLNYTPIFR